MTNSELAETPDFMGRYIAARFTNPKMSDMLIFPVEL
jgi:hypothetical protein